MALKIKDDAIQLIRELRPMLEAIRMKDSALHDQMRRALSSIPLNIAEGEYKRGGNARLRFESAMGSANEVRACLETAAAFGYVQLDAAHVDALDRIARTLNRVMR
jgi:four helix bundle protein